MHIELNGEARSYPAPVRLLGLLAALGLSPQAVAVERNGQLVPRDGFGALELQDGDRLEIVRLVGGG
ncbi:MAG TPA: sulfur carrier protein ThiS [Myxococcota bacterium]|nr:sulfur carrier protein ThiS [Myxococcota bacterium]HRY93053.1 sulfur carrier protein ThiS [Myxococcota bacterium]HSA21592.1 sulfur carrier protein ThiS [Myxococcota bacterium]